jgi:uncharacterized protein YkwD
LAVVVAASIALATTGGCVVVSQDGSVGSTGPPPQSLPADRPDASPAQRMARDIFDRVNAERAERGLEPVSWNEELAAVARQWSEDMSGTGRFEHQDTGELLRSDALSGFVAVGENIFRATGPVSSGVVHTGWMRSDGHRANVVNPGWNRLGVGVFCAEDGSVWATQEFGRTSDANPPPLSQETPPVEPIARPEETGPQCRTSA